MQLTLYVVFPFIVMQSCLP